MKTYLEDNTALYTGKAVAEAVRSACIAELHALKPGNVTVYSAGHDMRLLDFELSADAIAAPLAQAGLSVGERILGAIQATRRVVDCNTNLGIVLLCAPLAHAALQLRVGQSLRVGLSETLSGLDLRDAQLAYKAIRLAQPGGMGVAVDHDISEHNPRVTLLQAMRAAARYDRIAYQYVSNYEEVFEVAVPRYDTSLARWGSDAWATTATYLDLLAAVPDSLVARKFGQRTAREVSEEAVRLADKLDRQGADKQVVAQLSRFDNELKQKGINPGTSADLTVAALTVGRLKDHLKSTGGHIPQRTGTD
jgi:triphosphoribosyl-dephospho-CoA synthase